MTKFKRGLLATALAMVFAVATPIWAGCNSEPSNNKVQLGDETIQGNNMGTENEISLDAAQEEEISSNSSSTTSLESILNNSVKFTVPAEEFTAATFPANVRKDVKDQMFSGVTNVSGISLNNNFFSGYKAVKFTFKCSYEDFYGYTQSGLFNGGVYKESASNKLGAVKYKLTYQEEKQDAKIYYSGSRMYANVNDLEKVYKTTPYKEFLISVGVYNVMEMLYTACTDTDYNISILQTTVSGHEYKYYKFYKKYEGSEIAVYVRLYNNKIVAFRVDEKNGNSTYNYIMQSYYKSFSAFDSTGYVQYVEPETQDTPVVND